MKKTIIILSTLALITSGCNQATKQQAEENTNTTSANTINPLTLDNENSENNERDTKSLLFEETKDIMLNNKNHKITFEYHLNEFPDREDKSTALKVFFDNKEIYEINSFYFGLHSEAPDWEYFDEHEEVFRRNATKKEITALMKRLNPYGIKDNLKTITGEDGKEYLIFTIRDTRDNMFAISNTFINDNGVVLHNEWNNLCVFEVFKDSITAPNYFRGKEKQPFHIKNNKYYNVEMTCNWEKYNYSEEGCPFPCTIFEKTVTVKHNKVNVKKRAIKTITLYHDYCQ
jgi:hypothetical protein